MEDVLKELLKILRPLIEFGVITIGPVLVTWISVRLMASLKIEDEAKRVKIEGDLRDALHKSAANAMTFALTRLGLSSAVLDSGIVNRSVLIEAAKYVAEKNPEALDKLKVNPEMLLDILMTKAKEAGAGAQ